jgi:maltose O-acetyltransferase
MGVKLDKIKYSIAENFIVRHIVLFIFWWGRFFQINFGLLKLKAYVKKSGKHTLANLQVVYKCGENIEIGDYTLIGPYCVFGALSPIKIGSHVRLSRGVLIETAGLDLSTPPPYKHISKPIVICDGVWIGSNAIILAGVTIGENAKIGAGTVVSKDVPPNSIVVGQSARILEKRNVRDASEVLTN